MADLSEPFTAIEYWKKRLKRQGRDYVSRGGKTSIHQVKRLSPLIVKTLGSQLFNHGLDFGCGWGRFIRHMAARCRRVLGVDLVSNFMPKERRPKNVRFAKVGYPTKVPLPTDHVDLVFLITVLQHITGDRWFDDVTCELRRVMAPGAHVLVVDDMTATANHVRPRSEEEIVSKLGLVKYTSREITIDNNAKHQLIYGSTER